MFAVPMQKFNIGASFFIPCVNVIEARKQMLKIAKKFNWVVKSQVHIERDLLGVRFWRER